MIQVIKEKLFLGFIYAAGVFILCALAFQLTFIFLEFSGRSETAAQIAKELSWKFDGTFKNSPGNVWYDADEHIYVEKVTNKVVIGKLAGNRNLEFGVKNVLEEFLQDKGYNISSDAEISMSTLIIDEGGKFNQTSLSNALKKGCDKLVTKLFEK
jgi:hypothetical protein